MGNVCCIGRLNPQSSQNQIPKDLLDIKTMPNQLNLSSSSNNPENSFLSPDIKNTSNFDTVRVLSQRSQPSESLSYTLITAEDLSRQQQRQVLKVLDSFKSLLEKDEQEMVDGFFKVTSIHDSLLMVTTHALYLLSPSDLSEVHKRSRLEDVSYLVINESMNSVNLIEKNVKSGLLIFTDDLQNLVLSLQQVSFEAFAQYLPWLVVKSFERLEQQLKNVELHLLTEENLAITKVFVEHGKIGEVSILVQKCVDSGKNRMMNLVLVVSSLAVYMLSSSLQFIAKILLADRPSVKFIKKFNVLTVTGNGESFEFVVDFGIFEKVKNIIREFS